MPKYRVTLLSQDESTADTVLGDSVARAGGSVIWVKPIGRRGLTYPIKSQTEAIYTNAAIELPASKLEQFNSQLRRSDKILRHLSVAFFETAITPDRPAQPRRVGLAPKVRPTELEPGRLDQDSDQTKKAPKSVKSTLKAKDLDKQLAKILEG